MTRKFVLFALFVMIAGAGFVAYWAYHQRNIQSQADAALAHQAKELRQHKAFELEEAEMTFEIQRRNIAAEIENLQLDDKIRELRGYSKKNGIAVAKLENKLTYEDLLKSQEAQIIKQEDLLEKNLPQFFKVMQVPYEAVLDALVAARMANATGSEADRAAARLKLDAVLKKAQVIAEEYEHKSQKDRTDAQNSVVH